MTHCRTCIYYGEPEDGLYYKTPLQCLAEPKPYEVKPTRPACRHYKHKTDMPALDGMEGKECQKVDSDWKTILCPACGSQNVYTERRLNGYYHCATCHHKWPQKKEPKSLKELLGSPRPCPHCHSNDVTRSDMSKTCFCNNCKYVWSME